MLHGIHIGRAFVTGFITFTLFGFRALNSYYPSDDIVQFFNDPYVVFFLFLLAGLVITYPWLRGWKTFIIAPGMILFIIFFVYTYYIL